MYLTLCEDSWVAVIHFKHEIFTDLSKLFFGYKTIAFSTGWSETDLKYLFSLHLQREFINIGNFLKRSKENKFCLHSQKVFLVLAEYFKVYEP